MANKVNINNTENTIVITPSNNGQVSTNITNTPVTVTQTSAESINVIVSGPRGLTGPQGPAVDPFPYTGSAEITGSLEVIGNISGSNTGSFKHLKATTIEGNSPLTIRGVTALGIGTDTPTRPF